MHRTVRHVLIALALLFGQHAGQLHAFSHLGQDLGCATARTAAKGSCTTGHPAAQCLAFQSLDSALPSVPGVLDLHHVPPASPASFTLPLAFPPRIAFDSRAPPFLS